MAKFLYGINALLAWAATALSFTLNISGYYLDHVDPSRPTILGNVPEGIATPLERFFDWITYFTIWSNVIVAITMTALFLRPDLFTRRGASGFRWRVVRLDSLIMITVTGVVFNLLLSSSKTGIDAVSNGLLHVWVPIITMVVWLLAGPRGYIRMSTVWASLVIPVVWLVFALVRGSAVGAYPYPFLDVATKGWASVLSFVFAMVIAAIVLAVVLKAIDALIRRFTGGELA